MVNAMPDLRIGVIGLGEIGSAIMALVDHHGALNAVSDIRRDRMGCWHNTWVSSSLS
ncbi:hypothetical protein [Croceicoccus naphthovorans]|uniref:hypothetical protein n=1 Tax=Croceicoccus naphthovorans TaxID=1348774 RepID=UPI0012E03344|nr:hypothetical protein [Croceicoccus naphthovorans]